MNKYFCQITCSIYVIENNKFGVILSLLVWFEKFVTKILPFNLTCKTSTITNWWWPEILTLSKTGSMFITLEIAVWKVRPETPLKRSVLTRPSAGGILKKTGAFPSFPIIVQSENYFPWKFIILFGTALQFEKLSQKSRSYDCWPESPKKVWE